MPSQYSGEILDANRKIEWPVPFVENTRDDGCLPASIRAVLDYYLPQNGLDEQDVDALCGYRPENGAWKTQCLLGLAALGFDVLRIEDDKLRRFARRPAKYMKKRFPDPNVRKDQLDHSDIPLESSRVKKYLDSSLPFEQRQATRQDIEELLRDEWLVQVFVNGPRLFNDRTKTTPHVVLAVGFDKGHVILHNPDYDYGNQSFQKVDWDMFDQAWGGHPSGVKGLSAFRWSHEQYGS